MAINLVFLIASFLISQFPVWDGVVIKSVKLRDNRQFLPGDRVLVIKKEREQLPVFTPEGKFYQIDSSAMFLINRWTIPFSTRHNFPKIEMKVYKEPFLKSDWKKQQMTDYYYFYSVAIFNEEEKLFWITSSLYDRIPSDTIIMRWYPFAIEEIKSFISDFPHKNDSLRVKYLFGLGDYMIGTSNKSLDFYRLAYEWSKKLNYKDYAANSLLMLARVYFEMKNQKTARRILDSVIQYYPGVRCMMGRADAYATFKLLENAKQNNDTTKVCSLAKYIIMNFPNEVGAERIKGRGGWVEEKEYYQNESVWFDISAANILMEIIKDDDEKLDENANLLLASTNIAVKLIGYKNLIPYFYSKYEKEKALFYAKGAIILPHHQQMKSIAQFGCMRGGDGLYDFKDEFLNELESLLPFSYLTQLYEFAYNLKDTSVVKDAARWFINKIEYGKLPPRPDLTDKITSDDDKEWFKRAFLSSIDEGHIFSIVSPCTLFNKQKNPYYWKEPTFTPKKLLSKGDKVCLLVLEDSTIRISVNNVDFGWIKVRNLMEKCRLNDIPVISISIPSIYFDFTDDNVKDLAFENGTILDSRYLKFYYPYYNNKNSAIFGFINGFYLYIIFKDTILIQNYKNVNVNKFFIPLNEREGLCNPKTSFYGRNFTQRTDTIVWIFAGDEREIYWIHSFKVKASEIFTFSQIDSILILCHLYGIYIISAKNGKIKWQKEYTKPEWGARSGSDIFINKNGFVRIEGDSLVYRDFSGEIILKVKNDGFSHFPLLPFFSEHTKWGKKWSSSFLPSLTSKYIPAIKERTLTLISVKDGTPYKSFGIPENTGEFFYDSKGFYVSRKPLFRAYDWDGNLIKTINLPYISFPIWDNDKIVFYWSQPLGILLNSKFAEKFK